MKVKVCGLKYAGNIREVAKLSPDYMGFIFYPKSKRFVEADFVMPEIISSINKVGVFVNDSFENIIDKVRKNKLDFVQLHGDESPEFCRRLSLILSEGEGTGMVKIINAFGVDEKFNFSSLNGYENCCEYFLFDAKTNVYGGSGEPFDKNILKKYKLSKPYFLSGGIDLNDVPMPNSRYPIPFAIDVNSKFEIEPGLKDINKLSLLITNLRITNKNN